MLFLINGRYFLSHKLNKCVVFSAKKNFKTLILNNLFNKNLDGGKKKITHRLVRTRSERVWMLVLVNWSKIDLSRRRAPS